MKRRADDNENLEGGIDHREGAGGERGGERERGQGKKF